MKKGIYRTGEIVQKQHKPRDGYTGLGPIDSFKLASTALKYSKNAPPKCPCGFEFTFHAINKAKSTGSIRCPRCDNIIKIEDLKRG